MFHFLKNHPFAVEAYFEQSTVLAFAIPKQELQDLLPECLSVDTFQEQWGFIAVALVQTKALRPKGFPSFFGRAFFLIGYRIFVRFRTNNGKILRGLYILKSETNSRSMELLGNIFTHYNYATVTIQLEKQEDRTIINSSQSGLNIDFNAPTKEIRLPSNSPFANWKEARRFAGPLPFTFTYFPSKKEVLVIEGVRQNWKPKPISINSFTIPFLEEFNFSNIRLANAFSIHNIPYYWKKGRFEQWQG